MRLSNSIGIFFTALIFISCAQEKKNKPMSTAEQIHQSVITIDTHDDINVGNFTDSLNYSTETQSQVHIPGMEAGGLDVAWFIVYTGQDSLNATGFANAAKNADEKFSAIHRL
ncbi:MAG: peptidase M19, partial [Candidatus Arcticimaribacter sp.]